MHIEHMPKAPKGYRWNLRPYYGQRMLHLQKRVLGVWFTVDRGLVVSTDGGRNFEYEVKYAANFILKRHQDESLTIGVIE